MKGVKKVSTIHHQLRNLNKHTHVTKFTSGCSVVFLSISAEYILHTKDIVKVRKKAKIRNQYNQLPHLTQDTTWENDKNTRKHHTKESQGVSPFPTGDHKAAMNRLDSLTDTKHEQQKGPTKEALPWNGQ